MRVKPSFSPSLFVQVLLDKEREKKSLLEALLQTQGELTDASQQLEQLRQEVKKQQKEQVGLTCREQWKGGKGLLESNTKDRRNGGERRDKRDRSRNWREVQSWERSTGEERRSRKRVASGQETGKPESSVEGRRMGC